MNDTLQLISGILGAVVLMCTLLGLAVKFILLPYLREHLVKPMKQVEKQVTENHHSNKVPTVLDRIDDVQKSVDDFRVDLKLAREAFKGHTDWSQEWVAKIEADIAQIKKRRRWF